MYIRDMKYITVTLAVRMKMESTIVVLNLIRLFALEGFMICLPNGSMYILDIICVNATIHGKMRMVVR